MVAAVIIAGRLIRKWIRSCTFLLLVRINPSWVFHRQLLISTLMNTLVGRVFGRVETGFLLKIESKWLDTHPVSTKWFQNTSKLFHIFQKLQDWKNLVSTLVNIQALLIDEIMEGNTGSRSKFDSIPFHKLCLKVTIYSIYEVSLLRMRVECRNFKLW